ncbi:DUF4087 domain-containing protein [Allocoleopsis sp.]|uniref:DUF4087 domain-containing protein n=1 Tax=Allocoleopsis sp. TaxID=3088169 RepID=UPI002FD0CD49
MNTIIPILLLGLSILALPANATENRCGWLQNPTPANWWLTDRDGTWTISAQGGYQARGMDNIPPIGDREYVRTNGNYGYTCACLRVSTDRKQKRIISIQSGKQLSLRTCRQDPNLPKTP